MPTRPIGNFPKQIALRPEFATAKDLQRTPAATVCDPSRRDSTARIRPDLYKPEEEATLPAEEVLLLKMAATTLRWPCCYDDSFQQKLVLAPEYGGDGGRKRLVRAEKFAPAAAFPAHWAPNALLHYDGKQFPRVIATDCWSPSTDRGIARRSAGRIQPWYSSQWTGERSRGNCEIFADGFAGTVKPPEGARIGPSGLAVGTGRCAVRLRRRSRTNLHPRDLRRRQCECGRKDDDVPESRCGRRRSCRQGSETARRHES